MKYPKKIGAVRKKAFRFARDLFSGCISYVRVSVV